MDQIIGSSIQGAIIAVIALASLVGILIRMYYDIKGLKVEARLFRDHVREGHDVKSDIRIIRIYQRQIAHKMEIYIPEDD